MKWSPRNDQLAVMAQRSGSPWEIYLVDAAAAHTRNNLVLFPARHYPRQCKLS
jgi:hypothetical protein